jgi:hypothetical protein
MTMEKISKYLAMVKLPFLVLAIALAASFAVVNFSSAKLQQAEEQNRSRLLQLKEARSRYQRSGNERETILRYLPAYQQLQKQRFVGSEQRIDWLEALRVASGQAGSFGVTYQLAPQKPFGLVGKENPMSTYLRHSDMKLAFGLVHEGDLMRFFDALHAQQTGIFMLTDCSLDRAAQGVTPAPRHANLSAQCELSWLTIEPAKGKS